MKKNIKFGEMGVLKKIQGDCVLVRELVPIETAIVPDEVRHLCNSCNNACPNNCDKVLDLPKQTIDNYSFISEGYQILNDDGSVDRFIVIGCKNYELNPVREINDSQRKARNNVKMIYFGANSIEEANLIQRELFDLGLIKNVQGRLITERDKLECQKKLGVRR